MPQKRGLVLEGGASRGAFHIGAYKALAEAGLHFDGIVGTSVGALNGAMIAQGAWEIAWSLWNELTFADIFEGNEALMEYIMLESPTWQSVPIHIKTGIDIGISKGMDIDPLKKLIRREIDEPKIRNSGIEFGLTTINLTKLRIEQPFLSEMPEGTLHEYLLASSYMPIFQREKLMGQEYLDGCFYDNLPWGMLAKKDYSHLTMIRIPGNGRVIKPYPEEIEILEILPSEPLPSKFGFHNTLTKHTLLLGYLDAKRALAETAGVVYYIDRKTLREEDLPLLFEIEEMAQAFDIQRYHLFTWHDFLFRIYQDPMFTRTSEFETQKQAIIERLEIEN